MEEITTNGYVLRTRAYGESDRIVVLLTEELGKVSGIAKGARRSKRRFAGGALEPFGERSVRLGRRPHASLAFLHEVRVTASNARIAEDLDAFAWASYLTELTEVMTAELNPCPDLYALYHEAVGRLGLERAEPVAHRYILGLLDEAGWGPDFGLCGICAEPVTEYSRPILDSRGSGVVCVEHEAENQGLRPEDPSFRPSRRIIDPQLLAYVRSACLEVPGGFDERILADASRLVDRLIDLHLSRPLKSRAFLLGMRAGEV